MTKKSIVFLSIFLATAVLVAGGVLWYSGEVKKEVQLAQQQIEAQQKQIGVTKPRTLQLQESRTDLIWYKIPEFGLEFQIKMGSKESIDQLRAYLKSKGKSLVWYEVPELGIKFLISPEGKEDLKYVVKDFMRFDIENKVAYFYLESFKYLDWCKKDLAGCSHMLLSRILTADLPKYDWNKREGYPFCGFNDKYFTVGGYSFCDIYSQASPFSSEEEAHWFFDSGYGKGMEVIYESAVPLDQ